MPPTDRSGPGSSYLARGGSTRANPAGTRFWVQVYQKDQNGSHEPNETNKICTYFGHAWTPLVVTTSADGKRAVSVDKLGGIHVWNTRTAEPIWVIDTSEVERIYKVAWTPSGDGLLFGVERDGNKWERNDYGRLTHELVVNPRHVRQLRPQDRPIDSPFKINYAAAVSAVGALPEGAVREGGLGYISAILRLPKQPKWGQQPDEVIYIAGDLTGQLVGVAIDSRGSARVLREFLGHRNFITSIAQNPNGSLLATASTEGAVRIWNLDYVAPVGDIDFLFRGNQVLDVPEGSLAAKSVPPIVKTNRIMTFDGTSFYESRSRKLRGVYRPGQRVRLGMIRNNKTKFETNVTLASRPPHVEPLLSFVYTRQDEWVIWSPAGYFDSSSRGDQLIGWHINRNRDEAAEFLEAAQYQKLQQPLIVDDLFVRRSLTKALLRHSTVNKHETPLPDDPRMPASPRTKQDLLNEPPRARLLRPTGGEVFKHNVIEAEVEAILPTVPGAKAAEAVDRVEFKINGRIVKGVQRAAGSNRYTGELELNPGKNQLEATAYGSNGAKSQVAAATFDYDDGSKTALPNLYVLTIGVSEHAHCGNLVYAHKDARDFGNAWLEQKEKGLYRDVFVRELTNKNATKDKILEGLFWLEQRTTAKDLAIIFFAGHGLHDKKTGVYYLIAHDTDPKALRIKGIPQSTLSGVVHDSLKCKTALFVDACFSSDVIRQGGRVPTVDITELTNSDHPRVVWKDCGAFVLASSASNQVSIEKKEWENGAFTEALLKVLVDGKGDIPHNGETDSVIDEVELSRFVKQEVSQLTKKKQTVFSETSRNWKTNGLVKIK